MNKEIKTVPLPDRVSVLVAELHQLMDDSALLAALKMAKVEEWHGYKYAKWLFEHDPDIIDIKLGEKKVEKKETALGAEVRSLRTAKGLSQRQLADILNCDYTYISKMENGTITHAPSEPVLVELAKALDVEPLRLIFLSGRIPSEHQGLLSELAIRMGDRLIEVLKQLAAE